MPSYGCDIKDLTHLAIGILRVLYAARHHLTTTCRTMILNYALRELKALELIHEGFCRFVICWEKGHCEAQRARHMSTGVAVAHVAFERQIGLADADLMGDVATNAGSLEGMSLVRHDSNGELKVLTLS